MENNVETPEENNKKGKEIIIFLIICAISSFVGTVLSELVKYSM